MVKYDLMLLDFFVHKFGKNLGNRLISIYLKKKGIQNLEKLRDIEVKEQKKFVDDTISSIFNSFYDTSKIHEIHNYFMMKFILIKTLEQISDIQKQNISLKEADYQEIPELDDDIYGGDDIYYSFKIHTLTEGILVITINEDLVKSLARDLAKNTQPEIELSKDDYKNIVGKFLSDVFNQIKQNLDKDFNKTLSYEENAQKFNRDYYQDIQSKITSAYKLKITFLFNASDYTSDGYLFQMKND